MTIAVAASTSRCNECKLKIYVGRLLSLLQGHAESLFCDGPRVVAPQLLQVGAQRLAALLLVALLPLLPLLPLLSRDGLRHILVRG